MGLVFASTPRRDHRLREGIILNLTHLHITQQRLNSTKSIEKNLSFSDCWRCSRKVGQMLDKSRQHGASLSSHGLAKW